VGFEPTNGGFAGHPSAAVSLYVNRLRHSYPGFFWHVWASSGLNVQTIVQSPDSSDHRAPGRIRAGQTGH
jgi:hypothetical protein